MGSTPLSPDLMNRRDALQKMLLLMGAAVAGSSALLRGEAAGGGAARPAFTELEIALLDEVGETILPQTDIPGAKAVHIGAFMAMMVSDCYAERDYETFRSGMRSVESACLAKTGRGFLEASPAERAAVLADLDAQARAHHAAKPKAETQHYFRMMKELTVLGYFTSEIGCTRAIRYVEVPGAFHGDLPYHKGEPAWF